MDRKGTFSMGRARAGELYIGERNGKSGNLVEQGDLIPDIVAKEKFDCSPAVNKKTGAAVDGTQGDENIMMFPRTGMEFHNITAQTILCPQLTASGLNVSMDQNDNDGVEVTQGILSRCRAAFKVGTDGAFYAKCKFSIADVSGTDDCAFGFRKAEDYQTAIDDYDEMAALNVISGNIKIETILNGAATSTTDTTEDWADGETHTLEVYVSAAGVVTFKIDGAEPGTTASFTFDSDEVVVPFFYFIHASDLAGEINLQDWEVGLQEVA